VIPTGEVVVGRVVIEVVTEAGVTTAVTAAGNCMHTIGDMLASPT